jgi:predicted HAD superfamily Cof-like phosphohydrolase
MSTNWSADIADMHKRFGVTEWLEANKDNKELMQNYLDFRLSMVGEEYEETLQAIHDKDPEEIVDGLIDMCVFAIGTLDLMGVDANKAWKKVYWANMIKTPGVKPGRPNPFGLPDLIKPEGWKAPSHADNHGHLTDIVK